MTTKEYISVTETAKLVREALAKHFPGVKFSVRSRKYSGGNSIDIYWTDGPASWQVEPIARLFEGAGFDGSIDLKYDKYHWMGPDGKVSLAYTHGTQGSRGTVPADTRIRNHDEAKLVKLCADYIFCQREVSNFDQQVQEALAMIRARCNCYGAPPNDQFGNRWVRDLAQAMVRDWAEGEPLENPFRRVVLMER